MACVSAISRVFSEQVSGLSRRLCGWTFVIEVEDVFGWPTARSSRRPEHVPTTLVLHSSGRQARLAWCTHEDNFYGLTLVLLKRRGWWRLIVGIARAS